MRSASIFAFGILAFQGTALGAPISTVTDYTCGSKTARVTVWSTEEGGDVLNCHVMFGDRRTISADDCQVLADDPVFAAFKVKFSEENKLLSAFGNDCAPAASGH